MVFLPLIWVEKQSSEFEEIIKYPKQTRIQACLQWSLDAWDGIMRQSVIVMHKYWHNLSSDHQSQ